MYSNDILLICSVEILQRMRKIADAKPVNRLRFGFANVQRDRPEARKTVTLRFSSRNAQIIFPFTIIVMVHSMSRSQ